MREGKGNRQREVPLNKEARQALYTYREKMGEPKSGPLFFGQRGASLGPRGVEQLVRKYAWKAKLEGVTPHTLRHTFCYSYSLLRAGNDLVTVAALAGHDNLNTTALYTQPSQREKEQAVERLVE